MGLPKGTKLPSRRKYFLGDKRPCQRCGTGIVITERMLKHSNYRCAKCASAMYREWTIRNRERHNAKCKKFRQSEKGKAMVAANTRRQRRLHPEKYKARMAVQSALRNGTLQKRPCEDCCDISAEAHHDDYGKPLEIKWLCGPCHRKRHTLLAALNKPVE